MIMGCSPAGPDGTMDDMSPSDAQAEAIIAKPQTPPLQTEPAVNSALAAKKQAQKPPFYPQGGASLQAPYTPQTRALTGQTGSFSSPRQPPRSRPSRQAASTVAQRSVTEALAIKQRADFQAAAAKRKADNARYRAQTAQNARGGIIWDRRFARLSRNIKVAALGFVASARVVARRLPVVGPAMTFLGIGLAFSAHRSHRRVKDYSNKLRTVHNPEVHRTTQVSGDVKAEFLRAQAETIRASGGALAATQEANIAASQSPAGAAAPAPGFVPAGPHSGRN